MMNRLPDFLKNGDTIGLVAPSFGATTEPYSTRLQAAIRQFESRTFRVKAAPSCYKDDGLGISTDPKSAAEDLRAFYLDPDIDVLFSVGGGELMNETITHIDFDALAQAKPKWFVGYSDNTNFLFPMALRGIPGIYGPCAGGFGKRWEGPEIQCFDLLTGTSDSSRGFDLFELPENGKAASAADPLAPYVLTEKKILRSFLPSAGGRLLEVQEDRDISLAGLLLGGCRDVLSHMPGTRFDSTQDIIKQNLPVLWVLEACDQNPFEIRRSLWQLRESGWFDTACGFLIGRPLAAFNCEIMGLNQYNAVTDILAPLQVPVIMDADIGHISPAMPLVLGTMAQAHIRGNEITVRYSELAKG